MAVALARRRKPEAPARTLARVSYPEHRTGFPDREPEPLTAGAAYDIALHGAALYVDKANAQDVRRLIQPWQARTMSYYDLVPEVKFAGHFLSQMIRRVRLFPAMIDKDTHEPVEVDEGPLLDAFNRIQDRAGGRAELQASWARLRFLIGESYLTISPDEARGEVWECLSPNELRVQPGGIASRFRAPMLSADSYIIGNDKAHEGQGPQFADTGPDIINVYRLWRPHPAYSFLADCSMQAAVDILEELVLSTYSVRAELKSRLFRGGILWVPDEISFTSLGNDPEENPVSDEFQQRLSNSIMTAIGDPGSAAAFAPIIARVAADFIGKIQHSKFNDTAGNLAEIDQRSEMVERFAISAELPPELFKSMADLNHWGAWLVDDQTWDSYGAPLSFEMAADFSAAYLQPTARDVLNMSDWRDVCIGIDAADVINKPDNPKDATDLYDRRIISKKATRERFGYNDDDAMPDDERAESIGVATRDSSLAWDEIPSVKAGGLEPAPGVVEKPGETTESSPVVQSGDGASGEPGPPTTGPVTVASAAPDPTQERILGAAQFAVERARELAGAKVRAMTSERGPRDKRCANCQTLIDGAANWDVCHILGTDQLRHLATETELVSGAGLTFAQTLRRMGIHDSWADELATLVEQHAARTLCEQDPPPLPSAFAKLLARITTPLERV